MLQSLYIRNYAIIDEVFLEFDPRYNVITGETGAGKSILLGALGLILGNRADTKMLYPGSDKCVVEATFGINKKLLPLLPDSDDYDLESVTKLRREITQSGKSRAFINETPVRLSDIKAVAQVLVDIHNQFDTLSITELDYQRLILDAYSGSAGVLSSYQEQYERYTALRSEIKSLKAQQSKGQEDLDYLRYQLEELQKIDLDNISQSALEEEYSTLSNSEEIQQSLSQLDSVITDDEHGVEARLMELNRTLSGAASYSSGIERLSERLEQVIEEVRDISSEGTRIQDSLEHDPARVSELKELLDQIYFLQKKHKVETVEELAQLRDSIASRTSGTDDLESLIAKKEQELIAVEKELSKRANALSAKRKGSTESLSQQIESRLVDLAIPNAQIVIDISPLEQYEAHGRDMIDLLFSSNKGMPPQSIAGVASGGELSRMALSVKSLMAKHTEVPTMIFDEIDTGISGAVALQLARILAELSEVHQVICITHSPQVASGGQRHFFIHKKDNAERTITHVEVLSAEQRIQEIAQMLSTNPPSEAALANAKELLEG